MCGRYSITTPVEAMRALFDFSGPGLNLRPRYNAAPTQALPVVRQRDADGGGDRELVLLHWGLVPSWAKDIKIASRLINARAETAAEKPSFRSAMRHRRCLVPADGFYEWKTIDGRKQPFRVSRPDGGPFAFAGLWESWHPDRDDRLESFTILTTAASAALADIHPRMPVILPSAAYAAWLDPDAQTAALGNFLIAYEGDLDATPVSTAVNNVRNDSPACFETAESAPQLI
ncbi:MAG: SOS response-associated peptidase [Alphaproteobacteria bacterium]|nr:SOS response-associated peptidase [Alphaproteobacteria bacterium]